MKVMVFLLVLLVVFIIAWTQVIYPNYLAPEKLESTGEAVSRAISEGREQSRNILDPGTANRSDTPSTSESNSIASSTISTNAEAPTQPAYLQLCQKYAGDALALRGCRHHYRTENSK